MIALTMRALGVLGGLALVALSPSPTSEMHASSPIRASAPTVAPTVGALKAYALAPIVAIKPTGLTIPAIGVRTGLESITVDTHGVLQRPPSWDVPAWFSGASVPGQAGPAVIAGHVDSPQGPAVFWRLRELRLGNSIVVQRSDGSSVTFTVTAVRQYAQKAFPTQAVYGATPGSELRLITCAGTYDHAAHRYRDNMVVYAVLR